MYPKFGRQSGVIAYTVELRMDRTGPGSNLVQGSSSDHVLGNDTLLSKYLSRDIKNLVLN